MVSTLMLHGKISEITQIEQEIQEVETKASIAIVPLSIPLLAGPGAISYIILNAFKGTGLYYYLMMVLVIVLVITIYRKPLFQLIQKFLAPPSPLFLYIKPVEEP